MRFDKEITDHYLKGHEEYLRNVSVNCIISGFHDNELKVLLLHAKYARLPALPGGFIKKIELMDGAAKQILKERTGLHEIYMQQFYVFSATERFTKKVNQQFLKPVGVKANESRMFERLITVSYCALVDFSKVQPVTDVF